MAKSGGYPKFDPNKKYKVGDVVQKDGNSVFDGMGWGGVDPGSVTAQGNATFTASGTSASSFAETGLVLVLLVKRLLLRKIRVLVANLIYLLSMLVMQGMETGFNLNHQHLY